MVLSLLIFLIFLIPLNLNGILEYSDTTLSASESYSNYFDELSGEQTHGIHGITEIGIKGSWELRVYDANGNYASHVATFDKGRNHTPTAPTDILLEMKEDGKYLGQIESFDEDGDVVEWGVIQDPSNGELSIQPNGDLLFVPGDEFSGIDQGILQYTDGHGGSGQTIVDIKTATVNDKPLLLNQGVSIDITPGATIELSEFVNRNAVDIEDGTNLSLVVLSAPPEWIVTKPSVDPATWEYEVGSSQVSLSIAESTSKPELLKLAYIDSEGAISETFIVETTILEDLDEDRIFDKEDNCIGVSNPLQLDTDGDLYGNACDGDLDNDGQVGPSDIGVFRTAFQSSNGLVDFDEDGVVGPSDIGIFRHLFQNQIIGPSAFQ